jgi:oligosaccharide repeat unit polymerase
MNVSFNNHNLSFLKKIHPNRLIIWANLVWALLFFTAPLIVNIPINLSAYVLMFLSIIAFILGNLVYKPQNQTIIVPKSQKHLMKLFQIIFYLAVMGLVLKLADRFFIRGISINSDYFENRESMEEGGGNIFGILSAIVSPMGIIPIFLMWKYNLNFSYFKKILVFILFFAQIFDAFLLGSRSMIFVVFVIMGLYILYFRKIQMTFKKVSFTILIIISFLFLMNFIFIERTKEFAGDNAVYLVLNESNFNYTLTSSPEFKQNFNNLNPIFQTAVFTYITTIQYFTHGMIEFSYLYSTFRSDFALGGYTFAIYNRFYSKITGTKFDSVKVQELAPRQGVYTTFYGPIYLDFGWFTILFMFFFGRIARIVFEKARKGSDWAILIYFYFVIVLLFSPVFNFINGAGGIFILTSIILFSIISLNFYKYESIN